MCGCVAMRYVPVCQYKNHIKVQVEIQKHAQVPNSLELYQKLINNKIPMLSRKLLYLLNLLFLVTASSSKAYHTPANTFSHRENIKIKRQRTKQEREGFHIIIGRTRIVAIIGRVSALLLTGE